MLELKAKELAFEESEVQLRKERRKTWFQQSFKKTHEEFEGEPEMCIDMRSDFVLSSRRGGGKENPQLKLSEASKEILLSSLEPFRRGDSLVRAQTAQTPADLLAPAAQSRQKASSNGTFPSIESPKKKEPRQQQQQMNLLSPEGPPALNPAKGGQRRASLTPPAA